MNDEIKKWELTEEQEAILTRVVELTPATSPEEQAAAIAKAKKIAEENSTKTEKRIAAAKAAADARERREKFGPRAWKNARPVDF